MLSSVNKLSDKNLLVNQHNALTVPHNDEIDRQRSLHHSCYDKSHQLRNEVLEAIPRSGVQYRLPSLFSVEYSLPLQIS